MASILAKFGLDVSWNKSRVSINITDYSLHIDSIDFEVTEVAKLTLIFNNIGRSKTTISRVVLKTESYERELDLGNELIPLGAGESQRREFKFQLKFNQDEDELNPLINELASLVVIDNRGSKLKVKIGKLSLTEKNSSKL